MTGGGAPDAERRAFTVEEPTGQRLDLLIAARLDLSRTQAATLISTGHVRVEGRPERASYRPTAGELVEVTIPPPPGREVRPEAIPLSVVYEDDELLVVDKEAGMVVHPAPGNWSGTVVNALLGRGDELSEAGGAERAGLIHRLDKDTSGLLLVAKSDRAHRVLNAAMAQRRISRRYATVCWGHLDGDRLTVDAPIGRDPRDRKRMAVVSTGRTAKTDFLRLARFDSGDLLRARLHTGRTHQIRVHLASVGHPVLGDDTYGGGGGRRLVALAPHRHFLHAAWLVFDHPLTGARLDLRSPLPPDLDRSIRALAGPDLSPDQTNPLEYFGFFRDDP